jgi:beta-phosphoglucomutase-like phosphatase (HAD superfamily)
MPWDLVIFDCDGVLIDSEPLAIGVEIELLGQVGIAITFDEIASRYCGVSMKAMLGDLEARHGVALGDDFAARHAARLLAVCEAELKAMVGIEAVLDALPGKICVASSSGPERLRHTLGLAGLYRRFDPHIFSTTLVANGKPAPDLFLYDGDRLCRRRSLPPRPCRAATGGRGVGDRPGDVRTVAGAGGALVAVALRHERGHTPASFFGLRLLPCDCCLPWRLSRSSRAARPIFPRSSISGRPRRCRKAPSRPNMPSSTPTTPR